MDGLCGLASFHPRSNNRIVLTNSTVHPSNLKTGVCSFPTARRGWRKHPVLENRKAGGTETWPLQRERRGTSCPAGVPPAQGRSPGDEHGGVVVSDPVVWDGVTVAAPVLDGFLPLTEAV